MGYPAGPVMTRVMMAALRRPARAFDRDSKVAYQILFLKKDGTESLEAAASRVRRGRRHIRSAEEKIQHDTAVHQKA